MQVNQIYTHKSEHNDDIVFKLDGGYIIVKRSEDKIRKFNIDRWEEINHISEEYQEVQRSPTGEELKALKKFVADQKKQQTGQSGLVAGIIAGIKAFFKKGNDSKKR